MNLRLEILQHFGEARGNQARLIRGSGLAKPTVINAIEGRKCGRKAAQQIARAYGQPDRWRELLPDAPEAHLPPPTERAS